MVGQIAAHGLYSLFVRVGFGGVVDCDFLSESGVDFGGVDHECVTLAEVFLVGLVHFEGVDAVRVLVDQLHNVLQEMLQALALEVQAHQVTGVVSFRLEHLFCVGRGLPMLLLLILVLFI